MEDEFLSVSWSVYELLLVSCPLSSAAVHWVAKQHHSLLLLPLFISHTCPSTCFSRTNCSLSRYNAKGKLDCFNCKTGVFLRLFTPMFTKEINYSPRFWGKNHLLFWEYLRIIKKN